MPTIRFLGFVVPSVFQINIHGNLTTDWDSLKFTVSVRDSKIEITCETSAFKEQDMQDLYKRSLHLARVAVNTVRFAGGYGATVLIHEVVRPDGSHEPIYIHDLHLGAQCTSYSINDPKDNRFARIYGMLVGDLSLAQSFNDLLGAISGEDQIPIDCARAIEGLRELVAPNEKREEGWPKFRAALNCTEGYVKSIIKASARPRHGDHSFIDPAKISQIAARSWVLMNRYFELRLRGLQQLPSDEFALLDGFSCSQASIIALQKSNDS